MHPRLTAPSADSQRFPCPGLPGGLPKGRGHGRLDPPARASISGGCSEFPPVRSHMRPLRPRTYRHDRKHQATAQRRPRRRPVRRHQPPRSRSHPHPEGGSPAAQSSSAHWTSTKPTPASSSANWGSVQRDRPRPRKGRGRSRCHRTEEGLPAAAVVGFSGIPFHGTGVAVDPEIRDGFGTALYPETP